MKYSIVIPTYNKFEETLKPCLKSIVEYTDLIETEIIVVANGSEPELADYVKSFDNPNIRLYWFDQAIGYTKAANYGLKQSKGDYIVLLNNDTVLLHQNKNKWLEILHKPFELDEKMGATGPMVVNSEVTNRDFIIFFCVMIKASILSDTGILDEIFNPGYGEDIEFCHRIENLGYKIAQVPEFSDRYYEDKKMTGDFPIYHKGNVTFKNWKDGDKLIERNHEILRYRFLPEHVYLDKAKTCDGFMNDNELQWLAMMAKKCKIFIELGSWHGKSSRAIADNLPAGSVLFCVDHWLGSAVERDTHHQSAAWKEGDHAYLEFCQNMADHIISGKCIPLRLAGSNGFEFLNNLGIKGDVIFIDAGHTYLEVKEDIEKWRLLVREGGVLAGHDYYDDGVAWPGVKAAVDEIFHGKGLSYEYGSIWAHTITHKADVYDCFPFYNELDLLEKRFETMYDHVDRFVIIEASKTHGGKNKPYIFKENLQRFTKYLSKVTHIMIDDYPALDSWSIERHQRDCIMRGLTRAKPEDIVLISDVDEIPNPEVIDMFKASGNHIMSLEMDLYYYNESCRSTLKWTEPKIVRYQNLKQLTPCGVRYTKSPSIPNGGNHYSYFGSIDFIIDKIENSAHQENNKPEFKNPEHIKQCIEEGKDLFNRDYLEYELIN